MKDCPECGEHDSMYPRWDDHKCVNCGHVYKPKSVADEVPTRAADAECGEIIGNGSEGVSNPCVRKRMCSDGSHCSITARGVEEIENGTYMVVCGIHKE